MRNPKSQSRKLRTSPAVPVDLARLKAIASERKLLYKKNVPFQYIVVASPSPHDDHTIEEVMKDRTSSPSPHQSVIRKGVIHVLDVLDKLEVGIIVQQIVQCDQT